MISDSNVSRLSNVETGFLFPWFVKIYIKGILGFLISLLVFFKVFLNHSTLEHKYILYVLCHMVKKKKSEVKGPCLPRQSLYIPVEDLFHSLKMCFFPTQTYLYM